MDLQQKIIAYTEENLPGLYAAISAVPMGTAREGVAMTLAASARDAVYLDGSVSDTMRIQVTCKSPDSQKAYTAAADIIYLLEKTPRGCIEGSGFRFLGAVVQSNPSLAYMEENQSYVYVAFLKVQFERSN